MHLTERFNGKDVYLVGTANQSTMLAQRTQKLIEELKPDTVLVQASPAWWNAARMIRYVDSQDEMNKYAEELDRADAGDFDYYDSNRKTLAKIRLGIYNYLFRSHFGFGAESWTRPGLEAKFACEAAERVGANLEFMGPDLDKQTWQRLMHETRFNALEYFVRRFQYFQSRWINETLSNRQKLQMVGPTAFSEKCLDANQMNWYIQSADVFFPKIKKVMIDEKDEDLFA